MMPQLDGIGLCKHVKEQSAYSHIPFLMLTAKDALESRIEGPPSVLTYISLNLSALNYCG